MPYLRGYWFFLGLLQQLTEPASLRKPTTTTATTSHEHWYPETNTPLIKEYTLDYRGLNIVI